MTEPTAAPPTTAAPGAPASVAWPSMSRATIVDTVIAAMCPVLPRATPETSVQRERRRAAASADGDSGGIVRTIAAPARSEAQLEQLDDLAGSVGP